MPSHKGIRCNIELAGCRIKLPEYGTSYADVTVETFIAIPSKPHPFTVHLRSTEFIASGLSMHVFIDGVYQCNRNHPNLKNRKPPDKRSLVDFRVRQKEKHQKDGSILARDWKFEELDIGEIWYYLRVPSLY
jgi:hypothetical protein